METISWSGPFALSIGLDGSFDACLDCFDGRSVRWGDRESLGLLLCRVLAFSAFGIPLSCCPPNTEKNGLSLRNWAFAVSTCPMTNSAATLADNKVKRQ